MGLGSPEVRVELQDLGYPNTLGKQWLMSCNLKLKLELGSSCPCPEPRKVWRVGQIGAYKIDSDANRVSYL